MRRTLVALLFLVLVLNLVDRAAGQTNTTNTTGTNSTGTNTTGTNTTDTNTTNTNQTNTTNTTGTNTTTNGTNNTTGANTNTGGAAPNNITFFKANGTQIASSNAYTSGNVKAGKSAYYWILLSSGHGTVFILPKDVGSVFDVKFPLKLSLITQPDPTGAATLVSTSGYDGNGLSASTTVSAATNVMVQIDNQDSVNEYNFLINFITANYSAISPMGTVSNSLTGASSAFANQWDIYEMNVPSANMKVLLRLFSCVGGSQMYYTANLADAQSVSKTQAVQSTSIIPNNTLEVSFAAAATVYIIVNPYSGNTQSDGTQTAIYTLDAKMYNASTIVPATGFVAGGNGNVYYTRTNDNTVKFSWSGVFSASSDYTNQAVQYTIFVGKTQDNFTGMMMCSGIDTTEFQTDGTNTRNFTTSSTSLEVPLDPGTNYYVGLSAMVTNYAFTAYQKNMPIIVVPYSPSSYQYVKPSSSDSNPAGLGVTVFFLVLLVIIVIILSIVLYTKYKARKNGELGGSPPIPSKAAGTNKEPMMTGAAGAKAGAKSTSPPQSAMPAIPKKEPESRKAAANYAPPPAAAPEIKVDHLKDDHGLQQVDHHYEVEQQVPDNYDYQAPDHGYQGEEYNAPANQDEYNPDAQYDHQGHGHGNGEYEVPQDQYEVSPPHDPQYH